MVKASAKDEPKQKKTTKKVRNKTTAQPKAELQTIKGKNKAIDKDQKLDKKAESKQSQAKPSAPKKAGAKARIAKEEVKEQDGFKNAADKKAKQVQKPPRSQLERKSKQYRTVYKLIEPNKIYDLSEAVELLPKTSFVKFDASVEIHVNLEVDPTQADQMVRGTLLLPHGTGKTKRIAVLAKSTDQKRAKAAGADIVGEDDLLDKIKAEKIDFDILVATPAMMAVLGKYAKILGPKGLMPSPKSGTVTSEVATAVKELKGGKVEFRIDKNSIIHQIVGKVSFKSSQLAENIKELIKAILQAKPSGVKGTYISRITLTTTMGPGLKVNLQSILK